MRGNFTELQPYSYSPADLRYQTLVLMDSIEINSTSINIPTTTLVAVGDIKVIKSSNRGEKIKDVIFESKKEGNNIQIPIGKYEIKEIDNN